MSAEKPRHQRPEFADFWDQRFQNGITPWEAGQAPQLLCEFAVRYEQAHPLGGPPGTRPGSSSVRWRVLVPGCGSAWDAAFLAQRGWETTALDFSAGAIESARATLGERWPGTLLCADFFTFDPGTPFDVIYERAFLCALPRKLWADYAQRMAQLLRPGGLLAGYFFFGETIKGPPFGILPQQLENLLTPHCTRREDRPVDHSLPVFAGSERWQVWQRN